MDSQALVLFSFDFIQTAYVNEADPNIHLVLEESSPGTFKVIKNVKNLKTLFTMLQQLKIPMVCYTNKNYKAVHPIISKIDTNINWVYVNIDRARLNELKPNYSIFSKSNEGIWLVEYGDNLSNSEGKQQVRIAVSAAFHISPEASRRRMIFFENNAKQLAKLKQNQYQNIFSTIDGFDKQQFLKRFHSISQNQQDLQNQQIESFLSSAPSFDAFYLQKIYTFSYLANSKNIVPSIGLGIGNKIPIFRLPNSHSISSVLFRYLSDKQVYYGECQLPAKIGGDLYHEQQENKILLSSLHHTLRSIQQKSKIEQYNFLCIPMFISQFMMKNCLISSYNKNKGCFIVKPYVKNCKTIEEMLSKPHKQQQAIELLKKGRINGVKLRGLGYLLAISLICGEQFIQKGLFSTISVFEINKQELICCRADILNCFRKIKQMEERTLIKVLNCPQTYIKIRDLNGRYLEQVRESLLLVIKNFPFIESSFKHHTWHFSKSKPLEYLKRSIEYYSKQLKVINAEEDLNLQLMELEYMRPQLFLNLIGKQNSQNFEYFTEVKTEPDSQFFGLSSQRKNPYEQKTFGPQNFIIYGQCIPVFTLIRWIKQKNLQVEIIYISLLKQKLEAYNKQIKLAKSDKRNVMFIVDHCELEEFSMKEQQKSVVETNWGIKTIFIFRIKIWQSKKLYVLHDALTAATTDFSIVKQKIDQSKQEAFKTIFYYWKKSKKGRFQIYYQAISLYIETKIISYGLKDCLSLEKSLECLKNLTKSINVKNNRLLTILNQKQFNPPLFPQVQGQSLSETHDTERMSQEQDKKTYQHLKKVPTSQVILYCLPIYICNQKIWLLHDIHEFFNAFLLYEEIKERRWDGSFQGEQLKHFLAWYPEMSDRQQIKNSLIKLLDIFQQESTKKKSQNYVMGGSNKLNDCLQLLKKLRVEHLFCKLQSIIYIDSPPAHMIQISQMEKLIISVKGSVYKVAEGGQQDKKYKTQILVDKEKENEKIYLGSFYQSDKQFSFHSYYALNKRDLDERRVYKLSMKERKISQKSLNFNVHGEKQSGKRKILKMEIMEQKYCLLLFSDLFLVIGLINQKEQMMTISILREENLKELFGVIQPKQGSKQNEEYPLIAFKSLNLKQKSYQFVIALPNMFLKPQNSQLCNQEAAKPKILLISYLVEELNKDQESIRETNLGIVGLEETLGSLGLHISGYPVPSIQIIGFYQQSTTLRVWKFEKVQQKVREVRQAKNRYYRVEPDSNNIFKFGESFYVGSKYGFVKKMVCCSTK